MRTLELSSGILDFSCQFVQVKIKVLLLPVSDFGFATLSLQALLQCLPFVLLWLPFPSPVQPNQQAAPPIPLPGLQFCAWTSCSQTVPSEVDAVDLFAGTQILLPGVDLSHLLSHHCHFSKASYFGCSSSAPSPALLPRTR